MKRDEIKEFADELAKSLEWEMKSAGTRRRKGFKYVTFSDPYHGGITFKVNSSGVVVRIIFRHWEGMVTIRLDAEIELFEKMCKDKGYVGEHESAGMGNTQLCMAAVYEQDINDVDVYFLNNVYEDMGKLWNSFDREVVVSGVCIKSQSLN